MQQHDANILPTTSPSTTPTLGVGSKGQNSTFSEHGHVAYQIKGNGAACKHIFSPYTHPQPVGWIKRLYKSECGHVSYQIKGKEV